MKKHNILTAGLTTLSLILGNISMNAATWEYEWDAINTSAGDAGWVINGSNTGGGQSAQGFTIAANSYMDLAWNADASTGWTVAFMVKRDDSNSGFGSLSFISDGTYGNDFNYFGSSQYRISTSGGLIYPVAPGSSNMVFQEVQIARSESSVNVYMNGSDTPFASYTYTGGASNNIIRFGDFTSGDPISTIQYVNYTTAGAFTPSQMIPEPETFALLGGIAMLGLAYIHRRRKRS